MNTKVNTLADTISNLDTVGAIAAYRTLANSTLIRSIYGIQRHIAAERRENDATPTLDERNETDENHRFDAQIKAAMGFENRPDPMEVAQLNYNVYDWACEQLAQITTSPYDLPFTFKSAVRFLATKIPQPDELLVARILELIPGATRKDILQMNEMQVKEAQRQLLNDLPEIETVFNGLVQTGWSDDEFFGQLPVLTQYQLGVKVVDGLKKAKNALPGRALKMRSMEVLGDVPLLEDAINKVSAWVKEFESTHAQELREAIDSGNNVPSMEDVQAEA